MRSSELRIGNWVRIKDVPTTNEWQVEGLGNLQHVAGQLWSIEELEPIPLTEEWLERFGFEKVSGDYIRYDLKASEDIYIVYADDFSCGLFNSKESEEDELGVIPNWEAIKHVHSLQNLYFALTGEELQTDETNQIVNL